MNGLMNLFGGQDPYGLAGLMTPEQRKQLSGQANMAMAMKLLEAGGPSTTRTSLGQALGRAYAAGQQAMQQGQLNAMQQMLLKDKLNQSKREAARLKTLDDVISQLPPEEQAAARLAPDEYVKSLFKDPAEMSELEMYKQDPKGYAAFKAASRAPSELTEIEMYKQDPKGYAAFKAASRAPSKKTEMDLFMESPELYARFKAASREPAKLTEIEMYKQDPKGYARFKAASRAPVDPNKVVAPGAALVGPSGEVKYQAPFKPAVPTKPSVFEQRLEIYEEDPERYAELQKAGVTGTGGKTLQQFSAPPAGYHYTTRDGETRLEVTPGGPADLEQQQVRKALETNEKGKQFTSDVVTSQIDRMTELVKNEEWTDPVTGIPGAAVGKLGVPGTARMDAENLATSIKANIGFDRLQRMREESPTGGALGQVAVQELEALQATLGSLSLSQTKEQLLENLATVKRMYSEIMKKAAAYPNAQKYGFGSASPSNDDPLGIL